MLFYLNTRLDGLQCYPFNVTGHPQPLPTMLSPKGLEKMYVGTASVGGIDVDHYRQVESKQFDSYAVSFVGGLYFRKNDSALVAVNNGVNCGQTERVISVQLGAPPPSTS